MSRLVLALLLVPSLSLAQGLKLPGAAATYQGAPFDSAGCPASGVSVGFRAAPGLPLTVSRASSVTVCVDAGCTATMTCGNNTLGVGFNYDGSVGAQIHYPYTQVATTNDLSAGPWTTNTLTVTAGTKVDRNGTSYGATLQRTGTAAEGSRLVYPFTGTAVPWTGTVDLMAGTATTAALAFWGTNTLAWTARVIAGPGRVTSSGAATTYAAVNELSATSWTTVSVTSTLTAAVYAFRVHPETAGAGTNALTVYAAMPQLTASAYTMPFAASASGNTAVAATAVSVPLTDFSSSDTGCIAATALPTAGVWNTAVAHPIFTMGTWAAANSFGLYSSGTGVNYAVWDAAAALKYVVAPSIPTGPHRFVGCMAAGTLSIYQDGALISNTPAGAGTGLLGASDASLAIGSSSSPNYFDGSISNVRIYPNQTYRAGM